jgi:hydroxymethylglutaryl-CoA reductase (NADPH)
VDRARQACRARVSSWAEPDIGSLQKRLIGSIGTWWRWLESEPRTLIHHDFNPRNICLRGGRLCAYDWELAAVGAPQRDLAELLCFVLRPDVGVDEVRRWIAHHRQALAAETGMELDPASWQLGFQGALYDVMINRLTTYALIDRVRRQPFLAGVVRTWRRLYEHFPLEGRR